MNPIVPIAGGVALLFLLGGKKKKDDEEEEIIDEDLIEEEPLGGAGPGYGDDATGGSGDGTGGGSGIPGGITTGTWTGGTGGGGPIKRGTPQADPFGGGKASSSTDSGPRPQPRPSTSTTGPKPRPPITAEIKPITAIPGVTLTPMTGQPSEQPDEGDNDESVERQEDIAASNKKDKNLTLCQGALFALGVGKPPKGKWGYYNASTREHLKTFQANHGLEQTGVCDIETKRKLDSEIRRRSSPKFCFGQDECNEFAEKALYSKTSLYVPLKTDPNTGETLEGAYYRVGPNAKIYYESYEASIGVSPVLTGAWPFNDLPWISRYAIEKKIDRTGGDTWEVGKTIENEIFAGRIPGPGNKFQA